MKKLLYIPSLFRRVVDNTATERELIIAFLILFIPFVTFCLVFGHPYQAYYYSK